MTFLTPQVLKTEIPLTESSFQAIQSWRDCVREILQSTDRRLLLIVGPCSIHNLETAWEYAEKLKSLAEEVSDVFFIAMRAYFEKPRTLSGWKGFLYDPHLDGSQDMPTGVRKSREFLKSLAELGMPAATEFLDPLASYFLSDFITWGSIGARTAQSQIHRQLASSLPMPIGFKNRTDGHIETAIQAILSAKEPHSFLGINDNGALVQLYGKGNCLPHLVLRGGETKPNYDSASIAEAEKQLVQAHLFPSLLVDCSHDNCRKNYQQQCHIFSAVSDQIAKGRRSIRGLMLESFLQEANWASLRDSALRSHVSLTDPCLGWQETVELIQEAASLLRTSLYEPV